MSKVVEQDNGDIRVGPRLGERLINLLISKRSMFLSITLTSPTTRNTSACKQANRCAIAFRSSDALVWGLFEDEVGGTFDKVSSCGFKCICLGLTIKMIRQAGVSEHVATIDLLRVLGNHASSNVLTIHVKDIGIAVLVIDSCKERFSEGSYSPSGHAGGLLK